MYTSERVSIACQVWTGMEILATGVPGNASTTERTMGPGIQVMLLRVAEKPRHFRLSEFDLLERQKID